MGRLRVQFSVGEARKETREGSNIREECPLVEIAPKRSQRTETVDVKLADVSVNLSGPPSTPATCANSSVYSVLRSSQRAKSLDTRVVPGIATPQCAVREIISARANATSYDRLHFHPGLSSDTLRSRIPRRENERKKREKCCE